MNRREFVQLLWAGAVLTSLPGVARAGTPQDGPDLSTPEAAVKSFIAAFNRVDGAALAKCVVGATESDVIKDLMKTPITFVLGEVTAYFTDAKDRALVEAEVTIQDKESPGGIAQKGTEFIPLRKEGGDWKIVPLDLEAMKSSAARGANPVVQILATMIRNPDVMRESRTKAVGASAMSNVKQICLGALMYSQDYDEKFPPSAEKYKAELMPYIKNESVFTSPLDPAGTLSFKMNPQLAGKSLAAIDEPANTVMIYEGEYKKVLFRYEGKALIGFVDGHAKLVSPAEAAKLRWSW